jgi:hypothetical protein
MNGNSRDILRLWLWQLLRTAFGRGTLSKSSPFILEDAIMPRIKQASTRKRAGKTAAVSVLGAAGLGFSLAGSASASTVPTADIPQTDNSLTGHRFVLGEEEMADVSLATFYLFDRENVGGGGVQMARGGCGGCGHGCGGCGHGCGGFHGCGGCRGCAGCRGCGGFGGCGVGIIGCVGCVGCAGCCLSWGVCRLC